MTHGSLLHTLLDIGALNAFLIWQTAFPKWEARQGTRKRCYFLSEVAKSLVLPQLNHSKEEVTGIPLSVCAAMESILGEPVTSKADPKLDPTKRGKCHVCTYEGRGTGYKAKKNSANKVKQSCISCHMKVCNKHCHITTRRICKIVMKSRNDNNTYSISPFCFL